jgi:hypothetical protein
MTSVVIATALTVMPLKSMTAFRMPYSIPKVRSSIAVILMSSLWARHWPGYMVFERVKRLKYCGRSDLQDAQTGTGLGITTMIVVRRTAGRRSAEGR